MRYVVAAFAILALVIGLQFLFPATAISSSEMPRLAYLLTWLGLLLSVMVIQFRNRLSQSLQEAALWAGVFALAILGYSYRFEFAALQNRFSTALFPSSAISVAPGIVTLTKGDSGHFEVDALVNGVPVHFLVDTGASFVSLTERDARRAGIAIEELDQPILLETANGTAMAMRAKIASLAIGDIRETDVPADVQGDGLGQSLLGMSFLSRLKSYSVSKDTLTLEGEAR